MKIIDLDRVRWMLTIKTLIIQMLPEAYSGEPLEKAKETNKIL